MQLFYLRKILLISIIFYNPFLMTDEGTKVKHIKNFGELEQHLKNSKMPSLVEIHAEAWCGPCKFIGPKVNALSNIHHENLHFIKVNHDDVPEAQKKYGARGFPTFFFFKAGSTKPLEEYTFSGADEDKLKESIEKIVSEKEQEAKDESVNASTEEKTNGTIIDIESEADLKNYLNGEKAVVIEFSKKVCPFCVEMEPTVKQLSERFKNIVFVKVHKEKTPDLTKKYKITGYPTYMIFKNGKMQHEKPIMGNAHNGLRVRVEAVAGQRKLAPAPAKEMEKQPSKEKVKERKPGRKGFRKKSGSC